MVRPPVDSLRSRVTAVALAAALASVLPGLPSARAQAPGLAVPSPREFLGHEIGEDYFLANYTQLRSYWDELARRSDRIVIERFGETSYGQPMVAAVISSPANLARLEELRGISERLARGRDADEAVPRELCERGRAVIWIDGGLHATESVAGQNIIELTWQMTGRDDREVRNILDEVVLVVCPANPDGMEMIANAYMATRQVGGIPVLYQRYIGHDNNRDFYAANMLESRAINRMLYHRWYPQVVYNHHQSAPRGTIIFTPPFRDPFNYNFDPLLVRGLDLVAAHMNQRFAAEGKPGVISRTGSAYSTWWNGGLRTTAYFHNMIGILTESFGSPTPSRVTQTLNRRLPEGDYPDPVPSQPWHARQTIDYLQTANFAILDLAARYRREFLFNSWRMARNSVERGGADHWTVTPKMMALAEARAPAGAGRRGGRGGRGGDAGERPGGDAGGDAGGDTGRDSGGSAGEASGRRGGGREGAGAEDGVSAADAVFAQPDLRDARAYVLAADQPDFAAATRFVRALRRVGVEVQRTTAPVQLPGGAPERGAVPAGSFVVSAAQAFRPHVRDMFEPQWHPDDISNGQPVRPYDSAGWTLSMQMGVAVDRVLDGIDGIDGIARIAGIENVTEEVLEIEVPFAAGTVTEGSVGFLMRHDDSNGFLCTNRLLAAGDQVYWLERPCDAGGRTFPAGTAFVPAGAGTGARVVELAKELGVDFAGVDRVPAGSALQLRRPRIGLFDVYGGNMPTGWTEWVLRQFEFDVELVFGPTIHEGKLRDRFDVLLFQTGLPAASERDRRAGALRRGRGGAVNAENLAKLQAALPPFEDWSNAADRRERLTKEKAIPALREFLDGGGVLLAFSNEASALIRHLELPVEIGTFVEGEDGERRPTRSSEFFVPSSLLWVDVDPADPLGWGVDARVAAMFGRSPVFAVEPGADGADRIDAVARYADGDVLASGWAIGAELLHGRAAALRARVGDGKAYLFGADVLFRGQPLATFKLVFNAILGGPAREVPSVGG